MIGSIQDSTGYHSIRQTLSRQYSLNKWQPKIEITDANLKGNRELVLEYTPTDNQRLNKDTEAVLEHIRFLWGYAVKIENAA